MKLSVIIDCRPAGSWLGQALTGYALQTWRDFEVIVASGTDSPVPALVAERRRGFPVPLRHVHGDVPGAQDDALEQAIAQARGECLLFTRGDCVPRPDLVAAHAARATRGRFLCGGTFQLEPELSHRISRNDIVLGRCFEPEWLQARRPPASSGRPELALRAEAARLLEALMPSGVRFDPRNASAWKEDLLQGRGDPGQRLHARGVRGLRARSRALCLQLSEGGRDRAPAADPLPTEAPGHSDRPAWRRYG